MVKPKILIVDDEKPTRDAMARALGRTYECLTAADAELAMEAVRANRDLALVLTDYKMPGRNGVELIREAKAENPSLGAILITAFGEIDLAVAAMKDGADDFVQKPITDLAAFELRVAQAIKSVPTEHEPEAGATGPLPDELTHFTGRSPAMEKVYRLIRKVAPTDATVLVEGPSGTGKELVANALHALSPRAKGPFVAVECAALSPSLLESELFGYEKNAFTGADTKNAHVGRFESANGGTLFLDEIGEIDLMTQVKLLRVLESRRIQRVGGSVDIPVDFRLVAATNRDLLKCVAEGTFREDLYYRLNVIDIRMPALKDRPGDIELLVRRFLKEFTKNAPVLDIDPAALQALEGYAWPGNVRQLRNVIERMVVLASGPRIALEDLPPEITIPLGTIPSTPLGTVPPPPVGTDPSTLLGTDPGTPVGTVPRPITLADAEKERILAALAACRGNKSKAALELGISRRTLHRKLKAWGLSDEP